MCISLMVYLRGYRKFNGQAMYYSVARVYERGEIALSRLVEFSLIV